MKINWLYDVSGIDWQELAELYRIAPLGDKEPLDLHRAFTNSMYKCFLIHEERIIGVGRALADGVDCSYICDLAVHPDFQGQGLGQEIVRKLTQLSAKHKKIILYAYPGREDFYQKLGFKHMNTAMAIFENQENALALGLINDD